MSAAPASGGADQSEPLSFCGRCGRRGGAGDGAAASGAAPERPEGFVKAIVTMEGS